MRFINEYRILESNYKNDYFIGMNSGNGFAECYKEIINENRLNRLFIIKGAAGTGKSHLMMSIASACVKDGAEVQRFRCSSDPNSLDAILVNKSVAVLDGTSPHSTDMLYPGAASELIDLSRFWNNDILIENREEIISLSSEKARSFIRAYRNIHDAAALKLTNLHLIEEATNIDKLAKAAERLAKGIKPDNIKNCNSMLVVRSLGIEGAIKLNTIERNSVTIIRLNDYYGLSYVFMKYLRDILMEKGCKLIISPDPTNSLLISDIFVPSSSTLFTVDNGDNTHKTINMQRFIDAKSLSAIKGGVRLTNKCSKAILEEALNDLSQAGKYHFELEKIYTSSMDFNSMSSYTKELTEKILNLL